MLENDFVMKHFCTFATEQFKDGKAPAIWRGNAINNMELVDKFRGIWHLRGSMNGKVMVVCGAGPSLKDNVEYLKKLSGLHMLFCVNSSLQFLLEHDIYPDFIVAVDALPRVKEDLDIGRYSDGMCLLATPNLGPSVLQAWNGCIRFINLGTGSPIIDDELNVLLGRSITAGGNAFNLAVAAGIECFGFDVVAFVGADLSWPIGDKYYVDKDSFNDDQPKVWGTNIYGEKVQTNPPLYQYKVWLEDLCSQTSHLISYYNCSNDGILGVDGARGLYPFITQMPLKEFIELGSETDLQWTLRDGPVLDHPRIRLLDVAN